MRFTRCMVHRVADNRRDADYPRLADRFTSRSIGVHVWNTHVGCDELYIHIHRGLHNPQS